MNPARRSPPGFTLLEVLAALAVLGVVMLALSQGMQFGLQATEMAARERRGDLLAVDRTVRRMIALSDPGQYPEPATLHGMAHEMSFVTELPISGDGALGQADVVLTGTAGRLALRWTRHRHADLFGAAPAWQQTTLLENVQRVDFSYFGGEHGGAWTSSWSGERLPSLVRVQIVFPDRSGKHWPPLIVATLREPMEE